MNSFFYISQKIYETKNIYSTDNLLRYYSVFDSQDKQFNEYINVYTMIESIYTLCKKHAFEIAKFKSLGSILENIFLSKEKKEEYLLLFSKIQKVYHIFVKFAYIYKFKKAKIQVTNDLSLNPINPSNKNIIIIMQLNAKYIFTLNDLVNIIETALSNSHDFFIDAINPKNPYNNIPFNISTLYNIYFKCKESSFVISTLFHLFFMDNFNKDNYVLNNEAFIRDFAIKKYIYNADQNILYNKIISMLKENIFTSKLSIHKNFPKKMLIDIMRPFLYYKYIYKYGVNGLEKTELYKKILFYKLKKFYEYNNFFGRIIYCNTKYVLNISVPTFLPKFNTDHIKFHSISLDDVNLNINIPHYNVLINISHYFSEGEDSDSTSD